MEGVTVHGHAAEWQLTGEGEFMLFNKNPLSTIELPQGRFHLFPGTHVSLLSMF